MNEEEYLDKISEKKIRLFIIIDNKRHHECCLIKAICASNKEEIQERTDKLQYLSKQLELVTIELINLVENEKIH